jgi:5-methylcytosine-specific restriction endonuclease McrA
MGVSLDYRRHSRTVIRSRRWKALRLKAKRRDGWRCVQCGACGRLEVDHIRPVRSHPELAFVLANLQTLCPSCHSRKTIEDIGLHPISEPRRQWRDLIRMQEQGETGHARKCENLTPAI